MSSGHIKLLMSAALTVIVLKTEKIIIEEHENPSWLKIIGGERISTKFSRISSQSRSCKFNETFWPKETKTAFVFIDYFVNGNRILGEIAQTKSEV